MSGGVKLSKRIDDKQKKKKLLKIYCNNLLSFREFGKQMGLFLGSWLTIFIAIINALFLIISKAGVAQELPFPVATLSFAGFAILILLVGLSNFIHAYYPIVEKYHTDLNEELEYYAEVIKLRSRAVFVGVLGTIVGFALSLITIALILVSYTYRYLL